MGLPARLWFISWDARAREPPRNSWTSPPTTPQERRRSERSSITSRARQGGTRVPTTAPPIVPPKERIKSNGVRTRSWPLLTTTVVGSPWRALQTTSKNYSRGHARTMPSWLSIFSRTVASYGSSSPEAPTKGSTERILPPPRTTPRRRTMAFQRRMAAL